MISLHINLAQLKAMLLFYLLAWHLILSCSGTDGLEKGS